MRPIQRFALASLILAALHAGAAAQEPPPATAGGGRGLLIDRHTAAGLGCAGCHVESPPARQPEMAVCMKCHGNYAQLAVKTEADEPNPHASHLGEVACTNCHHIHRASQATCMKCHPNFKMQTP